MKLTMCLQPLIDYAKGMWILGLLWPDTLVQRVFFVMQLYLTNVWKLSFTHAAGIMNVWEGMSLVLPVTFQYLADAHLGNFKVVVISLISSNVGIGLVTLSVPRMLANSEGMCRKKEGECVDDAQRALFYIGMVLTAVGRAGLSVSVDALREEQKGTPHESPHPHDWVDDCVQKIIGWVQKIIDCCTKFVFYTDKLFAYGIGFLIVVIFVKKWTLIFGIPAIYTVYMSLWFSCGWRTYKKPGPKLHGSPITRVCKVFVAAASSTKSRPSTPNDATDQNSSGPSRFPRCLDKVVPVSQEVGKKEISKEDVKAAKLVCRMVPISITFIICGIVSSIGNTYFVEQANHMNRRLGKWNVPILALQLPVYYFMYFHDIVLCILFKDKVKALIRNHLKIDDLGLAGTGSAMLYSVLCCITAAKIETRRLKAVTSGGPPTHAAWLLFQFFLLAGLDGFFRRCVGEFYKEQALRDVKDYPLYDEKTMERYRESATNLVSGLGFMCGVLSVYVVGKASEIGGKPNWFQHSLNKSRLDRYYWFLAGLSGLNLVVYILVANIYEHKKPEKSAEEGGGAANSREHPSCCS